VLAADPPPLPHLKNRLEHRVSEGSSAPIGRALITGSTSSPPPPLSARNQRQAGGFLLRTWQRSRISDLHPSLSACGLSPIPVEAGGSGRASLVCSSEKAAILHVATCKSPWSCPVCAPKIAAARAESLGPQLQKMKEEGGTNWLVTLTLSHNRDTKLADSLDGIRKAWAAVTNGKAWKNARESGRIEYARGYDVTWSPANGWHPHLHLAVFISAENKNPESTVRWIVDRWKAALEARGYSCSMSAQDFQKTDDVAQAAAYAVTPAAIYEALSMATKRAKGKGSGATPFEILSIAAAQKIELPFRLSPAAALLLWREYVAATKGRRQAITSRRLHLVADEDAEEIDDFKEIALLDKEVLQELDRKGKTVHLFQAVEDARAAGIDAAREAARGFLLGCSSAAWWIVDDPPRPSPPPPRPPD
jgi:hypothetical protein